MSQGTAAARTPCATCCSPWLKTEGSVASRVGPDLRRCPRLQSWTAGSAQVSDDVAGGGGAGRDPGGHRHLLGDPTRTAGPGRQARRQQPPRSKSAGERRRSPEEHDPAGRHARLPPAPARPATARMGRPSRGSPTPSSPRPSTSSSGHPTTPRPAPGTSWSAAASGTGPPRPTWRGERRPGWEPVDTAGIALPATGIGRTTPRERPHPRCRRSQPAARHSAPAGARAQKGRPLNTRRRSRHERCPPTVDIRLPGPGEHSAAGAAPPRLTTNPRTRSAHAG